MNYVKNHLEGNFTIVPNQLIEDISIPDRARFLYVFLVNKPGNWTFQLTNICKGLGMHADTFRKYRSILCQKGWIEVEEQAFIAGKFTNKIYHLYPKPTFTNNKSEDSENENERIFPSRKKPVTEKNGDGKNHRLNNKNKKQKEIKTKNNINNKEDTKFSTFQNPNPRQK